MPVSTGHRTSESYFKKARGLLTCAIILVGTLLPLSTQARTLFEATVTFAGDSNPIEGLTFERLKLRSRNPNEFTLFGKYSKTTHILVMSGTRIPVNPEGAFELPLDLTKKKEAFTLRSIDDFGRVTKVMLQVSVADLSGRLLDSIFERPERKKWALTPGVGYSIFSYKEFPRIDVLIKPTVSIAENALVGKIAVRRELGGPKWMAGGNINYTLFPVSTSIRGVYARFLSGNFRVGFNAPQVKYPWQLSLSAGAYYNAMYVTGRRFGFHTAYGPQLFPVITKFRSRGRSTFGYGKLSPILEGLDLRNASNRELAGGIGWSWVLANKQTITLTFDFTDLTLRRVTKSYRLYQFITGLSLSL